MSPRTSPIATHEAPVQEVATRDGCVTAAIYKDLEAEYCCVRERVGLLDLSHYSKIAVSGDAALDLINSVILTDLVRLPINQLQSSFILDDNAKPLCELLIANLGSQYLLLCEGAAPTAIEARLTEVAERFPGAVITNRMDDLALVSVDGPYSWELLKTFLGLGIIGTRYLEVVPHQSIGGVEVTLCRAGKTGEYGYMLLVEAGQVVALWDLLKQAGSRFDLLPIGYRAVDICKMENRSVSMHNEGAAVANVLELNTRVMFGRDKDDFAGRDRLQAIMANGVASRIVGITFDTSVPLEQAAIAPGASIQFGEQPIGQLANAAYSFSLKRWIGLALIEEEFACAGVEYALATPQGEYAATTVSAPFLFNKSLTIRPQEDSYFA